jgi:hypothetical protein
MRIILILCFLLSSALFAAEPTAQIVKPKDMVPLILPRNPINRPPPQDIQKSIDTFFQTLQKGDVDVAFRDFLANSEHVQKKYDVNEFIAKTRQAFAFYGNAKGYELYDNHTVGSRMIYLTYFLYLKSIPLRWRIIYYAADPNDWKLINLSVDDLVDQSILSE